MWIKAGKNYFNLDNVARVMLRPDEITLLYTGGHTEVFGRDAFGKRDFEMLVEHLVSLVEPDITK